MVSVGMVFMAGRRSVEDDEFVSMVEDVTPSAKKCAKDGAGSRLVIYSAQPVAVLRAHYC